MILGPFWCERDKSWVRFIVENDLVSAEVAQISSRNPNITADWQSVNNGNWPTSYVYKQKEINQIFYSLQAEKLYSTAGKENPLTKLLHASIFKKNEWYLYNITYNITALNPFSNYQKEEHDTLTPYKNLPLTPEMLAEEWENDKKQNNHRFSLGKALLEKHTFFSNQDTILEILLDQFNKALLKSDIGSFNHCEDYVHHLKAIIEDQNDPLHQSIIFETSRTDFDQELIPDIQPIDNDLRLELHEQKKTFLFNLLQEEINYFCNKFNIKKTDPLHLIQQAVTDAQEKYATWYNDKNGVKEIRGKDGFFSRWFFRHGSFGQKRADEFKEHISRALSEDEATNQINDLLRDSKTAYHRHSFASFLLDELRKIDSGCWSKIPLHHESGRYNKNSVIEAVALPQSPLNKV